MTILVTGATGNVGRNVVEMLLAAGAPVRATSRAPEAAGMPDGVEVSAADLGRPESFVDALVGVEKVYLFPEPDAIGGFVRMAQQAGARHAVLLSSLSAQQADAETNFIGRRHILVERALEASEMDWIFVRPGAFAANTLQWAHSIRAQGVVRAPFGGANLSPVHEGDIAAVAVAALLNEGHAGAAYALTGPESITQRQQAS